MEYLFALYLFSGIIKSFLIFFNVSLPVDFTLLTGGLLTAGLLLDVLVKKIHNFNAKSLVSLSLLLLFYLWLNVTILYSPSVDYCYKKSFLFTTNILAFFVPLFYKKFDYTKFLKLFIIVAPSLCALFLIYYSARIYSTAEDAVVIQGLYLSIPEFCGISLIALIVFKDEFSPMKNALLIIFNSIVILLAGGRGPIIFTVIVLIIYTSSNFFSKHLYPNKYWGGLASRSINAKKTLFTVVLAWVILALLITFSENAQDLLKHSVARLTILSDAINEGHEDPTGRIENFTYASDLILDTVQGLLIGYGLGSYGVLYAGVDGRNYPHNIILEIWFEAGIVGVFLFSIFFTYVCRGFKSNPFIWPVLFLLLNAMKSSGLEDLRLFFGFLALLCLYRQKITVCHLQIRRHINYENASARYSG